MSNVEKLKELLQTEILPEVEDYIDELFELIASNKATQEDKEELDELKEVHLGFKEMLEDIENDGIDEDEALEIIEDLNSMRDEEE